MESPLFKNDLLIDLEPGRIRGEQDDEYDDDGD
jgi:hypothetical protein